MSDLIETLRESLKWSIETNADDEQRAKEEAALSLLSDRSALFWALLEDLLQDLVRDKVRVSKTRQEVTFDFRDEECDVWTFRAGGFNVVHYIEPPSDPVVCSSIRVEEFEKAEDLQLCLAAAIAFRDERSREVSGE